jgi:para-aminobenzoate synthetase component 1
VANVPGQPTVLTRSISLKKDPEEVFALFSRRPGCFYLDSALASHELSRFSYIGSDPFFTIKSRGMVMDIVEGRTVRHRKGDPLQALEEALARFQIPTGSPLIPFIGGAVGYLSYELGSLTEGVAFQAPDDLGLPEMNFNFYRRLLAYEHETKRWYAAAADFSGGRGAAVRKRLGTDIDKLAALAAGSETDLPGPAFVARDPGLPEAASDASTDDDIRPAFETAPMTDGAWPYVSSLSREQYMNAVVRIKEHIAAGDIYQANLTQRLHAVLPARPVDLYLALRQVNPGPYGCYLDLGDCVLAGQSPELLLSVRGRTIETRPIKGTRPRGATPDEDARLARELEASAKDKAELIMIADLERNDLGKVCRPGTVEVRDVTRLETFPTVHHLVAVVRGELAAGRGVADILRAVFPGGSITGAPKRRAMEILDSVEPVARGPYTGAIGLFGMDGTVDLNVAIRTFVIRGGDVFFGVGGGITSDSDPAAEYEESIVKARGLLEALAAAAKREQSSKTGATSS